MPQSPQMADNGSFRTGQSVEKGMVFKTFDSPRTERTRFIYNPRLNLSVVAAQAVGPG